MTNAELAKELKIAAELAAITRPGSEAVARIYSAAHTLMVFGANDAVDSMRWVKRAFISRLYCIDGIEIPVQLAIETFEKVHGEIAT